MTNNHYLIIFYYQKQQKVNRNVWMRKQNSHMKLQSICVINLTNVMEKMLHFYSK